jgi:hypothetical protein
MKFFSLAVSAVGLSLLVGCAGADADGAVSALEPTDEAAEALAAAPAQEPIPAAFIALYDRPGMTPDPVCDRFTRMQLHNGPTGPTAFLLEMTLGDCTRQPEPNERAYDLRKTGESCGSKIWEGSRRTARGLAKIKITDHRTRLCRDLVPAKLIVEETIARRKTVRYSYDAAVPPVSSPVTTYGPVREVAGIGGESTGLALDTSKGRVEIDVKAEWRAPFVEGAVIQVTGVEKTVSGVETGDRTVLDVQDFVACPEAGTRLDCRPRANVRLSNLCAPENEAFLTTACENVRIRR